nr:trissin receptor-like [Parasteatoda tepidariorum]
MTLRRLRIVSVTVWLVSAAYCSPRLVMYGTVQVPSVHGEMETICILKRSFYDSKTYDLVNFIVCFIVPLLVISILYSVICLRLWRSDLVSKHLTFTATLTTRASAPPVEESNNSHRDDEHYTMTVKRCSETTCRAPKNHVLKSRRKVIRLLVAIVFTFAFCHLPFHARKLWQNWSTTYDGASNTSVLLTIITTLILYMNSGLNPFLYAILSKNFRSSMIDVMLCKLNRMHKTRAATRSLIRNEMNSITIRSISISQEEIDKM